MNCCPWSIRKLCELDNESVGVQSSQRVTLTVRVEKLTFGKSRSRCSRPGYCLADPPTLNEAGPKRSWKASCEAIVPSTALGSIWFCRRSRVLCAQLTLAEKVRLALNDCECCHDTVAFLRPSFHSSYVPASPPVMNRSVQA